METKIKKKKNCVFVTFTKNILKIILKSLAKQYKFSRYFEL